MLKAQELKQLQLLVFTIIFNIISIFIVPVRVLLHYSSVMRYQRTIKQSAACSGVGLHTGEMATLRLHPAPEDHGIIFVRTDLSRPLSIRATAAHVVDTAFSTTLGHEGVGVQTVEHVLAACAGLRIDNLLIEIEGPEVPILDGSAAPFVAMIQQAGIRSLRRLQPYLRLIRPLHLGRPGHGITLKPAAIPKINCSISFPDAVVREQQYLYHWTEEEFIHQIAPARTFGFMKDVERMRAMGLIKGASMDNAVVVGDLGVMNPEGLRFADEFVRHKILDLIGDLALAGIPLVAHVTAACAGHRMNFELVQQLMAQPDAWVKVAPEPQGAPAEPHALPAVSPLSL